MATESTITVYRGEAVTIPFVFNPVPVGGIAAYGLTFTVAKERNSPVKLITKVCVIDNSVLGTFHVTLAPADTIDLPIGNKFWDVWRTDTLTEERPTGLGTFIIVGVARNPPA